MSISIIVIVIGNNPRKALQSLKKQIYTNFRIVCINENSCLQNALGEVDISKVYLNEIQNEISDIIENCDEEYVYIIDGNDALPSNALLEYARHLSESKEEVVYADECYGNIDENEIYQYEIKPEFGYIGAFQSLYSGRAVIWERSQLCEIIKRITKFYYTDTLLRELFLLSIDVNANIGHIPLVLLIKGDNTRSLKHEKRLLPILQQLIKKYTQWNGMISQTGSYNAFAYELVDLEHKNTVEFVIIEENKKRTCQLLLQLSISYASNRIIVCVKADDREELKEFCKQKNLVNVVLKETKKNYVETLQSIQGEWKCDIQILLSDQVQWLNRMNVERLLNTFNKPEVKISCPQIAIEGKNPTLVYAGGGCNSLALSSNYLRGRKQAVESGYDPAWTTHEATSLTQYCIAFRKEMWRQVFPMHTSISNAWQFVIELAFWCSRNHVVCEYAAQSAFWVHRDVEQEYFKQDKKLKIENQMERPHCDGSYWHWLCEYRDIIKREADQMKYAQRSYLRYMQESFKVFGLEYVKQTGNKRVLVMSHELSLTGAPLVLVQAVETLKKMNYDVLVVSPVDGPLRETYLKNDIPVIIEPELFNDFEYIKIAYDFEFVVACTVCLWPVIEALGQTDIPVLWWVHDSRMGYENWLRYVLPDTIGENIHLYCGGEYAQRVILEYRPKYLSQIFLYGLEDFSDKLDNTLDRKHWDLPADKLVFANIGQIISRKGQDVLIAAIQKLSEELLKQCVFVFVGGVVDIKIYNQIMKLRDKYPENIRYIEQIGHEDLKQFYREIDCIVCSSVDDPLPAFVAEGLMMSRICICSKNTAFNGLIHNGVDGYLFESGDIEGLYGCIKEVIIRKCDLETMEKKARELYEDTFTGKIFAENFKNIIEKII